MYEYEITLETDNGLRVVNVKATGICSALTAAAKLLPNDVVVLKNAWSVAMTMPFTAYHDCTHFDYLP